MKNSSALQPKAKTVSHGGRPREIPALPTYHPKIAFKSSIPTFSATADDILAESDDLIENSSVGSTSFEDLQQPPISQPVTEVIASEVPDGAAVVTEAAAAAATAEIVDRLREALREVEKSPGVSGVSKELLGVLVEAVIADVGADRCVKHGRFDLAFWAKARIWIVCFLILMMVVMNVLVLSAVFAGGDGGDLSGLPPPT